MSPEERIKDAKEFGYRPSLKRGDIVKQHKGISKRRDTLYVVVRVFTKERISWYEAKTSNGHDQVEIMSYKKKGKPKIFVPRSWLWFTGKRLF